MTETKLFCTPCVVELRRKGQKWDLLPGRSAKITCQNCKKRRFGMKYVRGGKELRNHA